MPRVSAVVTVETNDTRYALLKVGRDGIWGSFLDEELCPGLHAPIGGESRDPFRRLPAQEGCAAPSAHLHLEGRIAEVLLDAAQRAMDFAKFREDQLVGLFRPMDGGLSAWGGTEYVLRPDKRRGGGPRRPAFASGEIKNGARNGKFRAPILNLSAPIVSRRT